MSAPRTASAHAALEPRHFRIAHRLPRRLRLVAPGLVKAAERCYILEILLRKHPGIVEVRSVPEIGSLTLRYDPAQLPERALLMRVDKLLDTLVRAPSRLTPAAVTVDATLPLIAVTLAIEGMSCASCALLIELAFRRDPRVAFVEVNYATATAHLRARMRREDILATFTRLGYTARPMDTLAERRLVVARERAHLQAARRKLIGASLLAAPVMLSGMLMHRHPLVRLLEFGLSSAALFGSGGDIFRKAWQLAGQGEANMDSLIALGAGAAWLYSLPGLFQPARHVYFESAAGIVSFVLLGRYLEERARGKASEAVRRLIDLQPETACRLTDDGHEETVPLSAVRPGDHLRVRPGERVPADGEILSGHSALDESLLTGESLPVEKQPGDTVIAGAMNGSGSFVFVVRAVEQQTVLSGIIHMVDQAQDSKLPVQKLADRISARFVPTVGGIAALTFTGWLAAGAPAATALSHAVAVLLIACPCALGLATPTAIMVGTGEAARHGIYIRRGEALETAARLTTLVFDKTGTLTEGRPEVVDCVWDADFPAEKRPALLSALAGAEQASEHFLARAILAWCRAAGIAPEPVEDFAARPGQGVVAATALGRLAVGNAALLADAVCPTALQDAAARFARTGKTPVFVALDGHCRAVLAIADRPRPDARAALGALRGMGLKMVMASGDVDAVVAQVAAQLGLETWRARATPADKLALVRRLQAAGECVGMVGDGINDAPALAAADVGFAVGGGTDIAQEAADIIVLGGDMARIVHAVSLSRRTMAIIRQNLFWALGYNAVAIPVAAAGRLTPMIASAAMALSSVSVVGNSLRLQR